MRVSPIFCSALLLVSVQALAAEPAPESAPPATDEMPAAAAEPAKEPVKPAPAPAAAPVPAPAPAFDLMEESGGTTVTLPGGFLAKFEGYFRAPLRITIAKREGEASPDDRSSYDFRLSRLIDSDYYKSNFAYTSVNESDWAEFYLTAGTLRYTATIGIMATSLTDYAFSPDTPTPAGQKGISQAYITLRFAPAPGGQEIRIKLKAGAFWERFGYQERYDTFLFGRTHIMGEQLSAETTAAGLTFSLLQGFGVHLPDTASEGLAVAHYYRASAAWSKRIELGVNYLDTFSQDKVRGAGTDSEMWIAGVDLHTHFEYFGDLTLGFSYLSIANPNSLAAAIEVMHTFKGQSLEAAYLGPNAKKGSLTSVGFAYDYHLGRVLQKTAAWPLPEGSDLVLSFFLLSLTTGSDIPAPDLDSRSIWEGFDGRRYLKLGFEVNFRIVSWLGVSLRFDKVSMDRDDPRSSFLIVSPRIAVYPGFGQNTQVFLQYSRYGYGSNVKLQPQDAARYGDTIDRDVIKLQAQSSF
jgi:hypothetical protein